MNDGWHWAALACVFFWQDADVATKYATIDSRFDGLICLAWVILDVAFDVAANLTSCGHKYLTNQTLHLLFHCWVRHQQVIQLLSLFYQSVNFKCTTNICHT